MAEEKKAWARTRNTEDLGDGRYSLQWLDENGNTLVSMELMISGGNPEATIDANYNMMRQHNLELFAKSTDTDLIMSMEEEVENGETV